MQLSNPAGSRIDRNCSKLGSDKKIRFINPKGGFFNIEDNVWASGLEDGAVIEYQEIKEKIKE